ncbi:CAP domain-containing protein [Salinispora sp. H7-4]|uniref:CAP domain-containing protein n=1 Tax=Salinispora sp. H7-4 TaxID=2748321 RepID=UPI0015D1C5DA|nr:CAP domain-containing protein [Salinispora sp. H7-4]NYT95924.1 CAP domain-containing protein [Salinispora sp. H7-4]
MYGWSESMEPDGDRREPKPAADVWDRPADDWDRRQQESSGGRHRQRPAGGRDEPAGPTGGPASGHRIGGASSADSPPANKGPRVGHRTRRPVLIGATAAATLAVSLGVGAAALSDGDELIPTSGYRDIVATKPTSYHQGGGSRAERRSSTSSSSGPSATPSTAAPSRSTGERRGPAPEASRYTAKPRPTRVRKTAAPRPTQVSTTAPTTAPAPAGVSAEAGEVIRLANAERAKAGCAALSVDDKLMTAAQRHSQDQADHRKMSHTGSNGSSPGDRLGDVGYQWRTYGENVAWNQQSPEAVMTAWMNSPGHRANILNCSFTEIGVGVASSNGPYWTQVFAAPR